MPSHPDLDCGDIVAARSARLHNTCHRPKLFDRRSTSRVAAALAGMLACASALPAQASTNDDTGAVELGPDWVREAGSASWYAASRHAWRTASGARYDQQAMTAAHPWLPFGAKVRVTRRDTGHSIVVTINDRLPSKKHIIDLSVGAAQRLGMIREGTTLVDLEPA